ncbi:MAG: GGDEF domain-containing protein [Firmicutes bacterium]|nr:GGDEF domain-containing protein [Bacillota bacterium]
MKTVRQIMSTTVVTVEATRTAAEAAAIMLERDVAMLPVVDSGRLVGVVTMRDLLRTPPYRPLEEVMRRDVQVVAPDASVTGVYATMERQGVAQLPVVEEQRLVGLVSREDVIRALGLPIDPLTELPWAVTLRERAVEELKAGREIAILFFDLDDFGAVNKRYGHVTGDGYIKAVAQALASTIDPKRDFLCRYAGDEFAVLTTRPRADAEALGRRALEAIAASRPDEAPAEIRLTASLGIAGGKRTTERQDIHFQATVDDLITLASRYSTQAKALKEKAKPGPAPAPGQPRLQVRRVAVEAGPQQTAATVELALGPRRYVGTAAGARTGLAGWRQLADATVQAVNQALPDGCKATLGHVGLFGPPGESLVVVTVYLSRANLPAERLTGGTRVAGGDVGTAVVGATLDALNRRLGLLLADASASPTP